MMTLFARKTLSDCEIAYGLLKNEKADSQTWRIYWVACLSLLRAVGHVLDKVDCDADQKHRDCIARAWTKWKADRNSHSIFWNFIEAERNNLLKQYKFGVQPEPIYLVTEEGDRLVTEKDEPLTLEQDYFKLSLTGLEDREGRDAISEAIKWWKQQLDAIEAELE
jgi:hypothetical protein